MSISKYAHEGYGQIELNQVTFRRDGNIEAQCALGSDFSAKVPAENGMLLAVDKVNRTVGFPKDGNLPIGVNYTTEHMYDERANALKDFALFPGTFLPRIGFLKTGDTYTTNTICYDTTDFNNDEAVDTACETGTLSTTPIFGGACTENGYTKLTKTKPEFGPVLRLVKKTTMPDGSVGFKFQVISAQ